jgi:hypothetical protein
MLGKACGARALSNSAVLGQHITEALISGNALLTLDLYLTQKALLNNLAGKV